MSKLGRSANTWGKVVGLLMPGVARSEWEIVVNARSADAEALLTPAEVASMFRVDPKTVTRWAKSGKLTSIRTLGGHRRYREAEVKALLAGIPAPRQPQGQSIPQRTF